MLTVAAILLSLLIVAFGGFRYVPDAIKGAKACHECGYSLVGTPSVPQCPECGTREPMDHPRYVWSWSAAGPFLLAGALWVGSTMAAERLATPLRLWAYEVRTQLDAAHVDPPHYTGVSVLLIGAALPAVACLRRKRFKVLTMALIVTVALVQYIGGWPLRCLLAAERAAQTASTQHPFANMPTSQP